MSWDAMLRDEEARGCCAPPASGAACVDCPEVTDDMVERACEAFGGLIAPKWEHAGEWEREHVRASMRAALVAALTPTHVSDEGESDQ